MRALLLSLLTMLAIGCPSMKQGDPQASSPQTDALATRLGSVDVARMATGLASDAQVQALWAETTDATLYAAIVADGKRPAPVRFAAALVLRSHGEKADPAATAEVFAAALQQDLVRAVPPWGKLWASGGDGVGPLGAIVVELGRPAIPALTALLDDTTPRDKYPGSEEATEMRMKRYRVKDFAAFYLAKITGAALPWEQDLARRDEAIARLRAQVAP